MPHKGTVIEALPDDLRETIEEDVRSGEFADADEAIRKAILTQHERVALRQSLIEAEAQIERGEFFTPEESQARSAQLLDELKRRNG
jgi:Arc/MetJ-type ribon-helix-helix transcriptional regulator